MNEKKNKEMTKEQMKEYFYNIIEDLKRQIQTCDNIIKLYENQEETTETEKNILKFNKEDKHQLVGKTIYLEEMFEKMFAIRYFDYSWNKKQESEVI